MSFLEGELVIINEHAKNGLPSRNGEIAEIIYPDYYKSSQNYQYYVQFEDGGQSPVKEIELNKLTEEQKQLVTYIKTGNKVTYTPTGEIVTILKSDFLHGQIEVEFEDAGIMVVGIETLRPIEEENWRMVEQPEETRTESHRKVIEEIHNTFIIKNADYGNSFGEQYEEYGLLSALIRLDDKMRRLKQLNKQEAQVKDESIRDTVLDLANYAIMTVMELDSVK